MKSLWIFLVLGALGCSKAELPLGPSSPTTLNVVAIDDAGTRLDSAQVFIDGSFAGTTPFSSQNIVPGLHSLRVTSTGFSIYTEQLLVEDGQSYNIEVLLSKLPPGAGQLLVTVNIDSARTQVQDAAGNIIFETMERAFAQEFMPGMYRVCSKKDDLPAVEQEVQIEKGKTTKVNIEFEQPGGVPPNLSFNVVQEHVKPGQAIDLSWQSDGVQVIIDQGIGLRGPTGAEVVTASETGMRVFTATAYSFDNLTTQVSDSVMITAERAIPPSLDFSVEEDSVEFGQPVSLAWHSSGRQVVIDQGVGTRGPDGAEELVFRNPGRKVFTATAYGNDNMLTIRTDSVFVKEAPLPERPVLMLSTTRLVTIGNPATISWQSQNADYVVVDYVNNAAPVGSVETIFTSAGVRIITATAFNQAGYVSATDTIEVVTPKVFSVDDILLSAQVTVRADKGAAGEVAANVATFDVETAGRYRVFAEVWYNSGDSQRNESYYLDISDASGTLLLPRDGNAGNNRVVPDDPGDPHTLTRDSGVFKLEAGSHSLNVYHYARIAQMYPQFLNGPIDGPESVKILGFKLVYLGQ